ncbi:MAG: hypothetical protein UY85_C0010G0006 [Candidatus Peribacteria bacterium GW2011_GWB1_54_5]|nr:MAG: hypothetical protein UY85_C0010G0006 [Candidatus Peribacteria bacterium GW2011_GWB1_54_5]OGJ73734.1 MAG: hypothetical protein A2384_04110 [Candidatus Peribacteria bacterium RIFOXYB1_FULL_54_35]
MLLRNVVSRFLFVSPLEDLAMQRSKKVLVLSAVLAALVVALIWYALAKSALSAYGGAAMGLVMTHLCCIFFVWFKKAGEEICETSWDVREAANGQWLLKLLVSRVLNAVCLLALFPFVFVALSRGPESQVLSAAAVLSGFVALPLLAGLVLAVLQVLEEVGVDPTVERRLEEIQTQPPAESKGGPGTDEV